MLWQKELPGANLVIRGARVLDPTERIDGVLDVRIDSGIVAALGTDLDANGHRVIDGAGLVLAPAFIDPHVHLRTPGREDEETIATGTAAAAAGGYCAILAMPNTEPVVDTPDVLRMQRERMLEGANFVPSLREYTTLWGVTPERLRPGQRVMHPGPMNRGVEIDPRVADSDAALVVDQVRAGLVVRMAVLYDLLTTGPVVVETAVVGVA